LLCYGVDAADLFRRAGPYVDRILKGTSPRNLPVQGPNKYEIIVNLRTARTIGLAIPVSFLAKADEVIE